MTCSSCGLRRRVGEETPVIDECGEVIYTVLRCPLADACRWLDEGKGDEDERPRVRGD